MEEFSCPLQTPNKQTQKVQAKQDFSHLSTVNQLPYQVSSSIHSQLQKHPEKFKLIKGLLKALALPKTATTFKKETSRKVSTNPEESPKKQQRKKLIAHRIDFIISESKNFDQMLYLLDSTLKDEEETEQNFPKQTIYDQKMDDTYVQKFVQDLFKIKRNLTIPVHKTLSIAMDNKEAILLDISEDQSICFIDNDNYLNVVKHHSQKVVSLKLDKKIKAVELKWIDAINILILTSTGAMYFYSSNPIEELNCIDNHPAHIIYSQIHRVKQNIHVLTYTETHFIFRKVVFKGKDVKLASFFQIGGPAFDYLKPMTVVLLPEYSSMTAENEECRLMFENEHYFGLSSNRRKIIKFDTNVEKIGTFYKVYKPLKIMLLTTSKCRQFLFALIAYNYKLQQQNSAFEGQYNFDYEIMKLDGRGCVAQCFKKHFVFKDFPLSFLSSEYQNKYLEKQLGMSHELSPWWLRCFAWKNQLYFFSLKTGRIVHRNEVGSESLKIRKTGSYNCLILDTRAHLLLISEQEQEQKNIKINRDTSSSDVRQSILQRLARAQGIPENLLMLLRSRTIDLQNLQL